MKITQMLFPVPTPALYVGSMEEWHGDVTVTGPYPHFGGDRWRVELPCGEVLWCPNRSSFVTND